MVATGLVGRWSVEGARAAWALLFACGGAVALAAATVPTLPMQGGSLISVNPLGASPGITIFITGTGFNTTASMNVVTFTPASGPSATAIPSAIATVDAALDRRRLTVVVPQALPAGRTALSVTNTATGSTSSGLSLEVLHITGVDPPTGAPGTTGLRVVLTASGNTGLIAGNTLVNLGVGLTVRQVQVLSPTQAAATVDIAAAAALGPRNVILRSTNQSLLLPQGFAVSTAAPANREPEITSTPVLTATVGQAYAYQVLATDPDGDPLTYSLPQAPAGMAIGSTTGAISWTPQTGQAGSQAVTVHVADGKGGTDTQGYAVQVDPPPAVLTAISADPALVRFAALEATRALSVVGQNSDGSSVDLTAGSTGTTYSSSNPFVASVSADGLVTARGNGDATITAANSTFTDTVAVAVEVGVTLEALALSPPAMTLRLAGATQALTLNGTFSDGSVRDLTSSPGTSYSSSVASVASVSAAGLVLAATNGSAQITASHGDLTATAEVVVSIPQGQGFIRGAAFDDSRSLPLPGATVLLLSDGGGVVDPPATTLTDEGGRYVLPGRGGGAVVRVQKSGFTTVDRRVEIPASGVARVLDTRLTPIDSRSNALQSVFGGQARDTAGGVTLTLPSGALPADTDLRVTPISPQGLAGRLPAGWSPVAAVDVLPATMTLSQTATLVVPNAGGAAPSSEVTVVEYDRLAHRWVALPAVQVAADGRTLTLPVTTGGQFVFLVADEAPFTPPSAVPGQALSGVDLVALPGDLTADGEVLPRSAPPGNSARAIARVAAGAASPLPSGTAVQVHVSERFELLDSTSVVPQPFTQDILVHARPRPPTGGALGAAFPVTPSRAYTIQELMRGVVTLDVTGVAEDSGWTAAGAQGAVVSNSDGDALVISPSALGHDTLVRLLRSPSVPGGVIPAEFELLGALEIDLVGTSLAVPGQLSTGVPAGVTSSDQILLVQSFIDPTGVRRLRVAGVGRIEGDRLVSDHVLGSLQFTGVTAGGQYFFLKAAESFGFVTGVITGADGATPAPLALVTSSTAPFVDVTGAAGRYVVAARAAADAGITVRHLLSADGATGLAHPAARDAVVLLPLTLAVAPPSVVAMSPAAGALNVPRDASITIDFSEPIDGSTITADTVLLQTVGAPVPVSRLLSQDRRRLTIRPESPLIGKTTYTVTLTSGVKDLSGAGLVLFAPASFTTLDPTKPPQPPSGQIIAELPDADGLILVTGTVGTAEAGSPVTATNTRTQETVTVLALTDGSFRFRITGVIGDEVTLTLRDASGRETTISLTQLEGPNGSTAIGARGGVIRGADGRSGTILPRSLVQAGIFQLQEPTAAAPVVLDAPFSYVDRFTLIAQGAGFNALASLTFTESQGRIALAPVVSAPFAAAGELTIPADFLVNSSIRFSAVAQDAAGTRRSATATTVVVAGSPDSSSIEAAQGAEFPTIFVTVPREATQNQVIVAGAVAPTARIELSVPAPVGATATTYLLTRFVEVAGQSRLSVLDSLERATDEGGDVLRTSGRTLPGMTAGGDYAVVASTEPLAFVIGQLVGAPGTVSVDGLPFVFETTGPNGRFSVPVRADHPYTLQFFNEDGSLRGTSSGQAPATGIVDVGDPLGIVNGHLLVTAEPGPNNVVDINAPIVLRFSEAIDVRTLAAAVVITDPGGARVFGRFSAADASTVEFRPLRRWRFGTTYRIGVSTSALALSGARLTAPYSSQFTTFAPSVIGQALVGIASDVGVADSLALVATGAGASLVNVTSPLKPQRLAEIPIPGGTRAAALLPVTSITTRTGQILSGRFAVVASGDATSSARLHLIDVTISASPVLLGSTQLTTAPGDPAAAGVPDAAGTPRQVAITNDNRALVAIENVGLVAVRIDQMTPDDPANPGLAIVGRYPAAGAESTVSVALVGDRVLLTGAAGLTVLNGTSLERLAVLSAGSPLGDIDAVTSFSMDANGDGAVSAASEVFELAVAAGADGTIQLFDISESGVPALLSVVRTSADIRTVTVDAGLRLAYVGLGGAGVGIIDLDGPASIQPLDLDRNGIDDRILGAVETPGSATRVALSHGRGFVADASGGLTVLRLQPPRVRFEEVLRDPVRQIEGEEQTILASRIAYLTDDGLRLTIDADLGEETSAILTIDEVPTGGAPVLSFSDSALAVSLEAGVNSIQLEISDEPSTGSQVRLSVRRTTGEVIASLDLSITLPDPVAEGPQSLMIGPATVTIGVNDPDTLQLGVAGVFEDGRIFNLTRAASGTRYTTATSEVLQIGPDGLLTVRGGGTGLIEAQNGTSTVRARVSVNRPPVLVALVAGEPVVSFRMAGGTRPVPIFARFSDGGSTAAAALSGTTFTSSNPQVVSIDTSGVMNAITEGEATISAANNGFTASLLVRNEWRAAPAISDISLILPDRVTVDDGHTMIGALLRGTGSLDGLTVTFDVSGVLATTAQEVTAIDGAASTRIELGSTAGVLNLTASIVDPATGALRSVSGALAIAPAADTEPNDTTGGAGVLAPFSAATGTLSAGADAVDMYRIPDALEGTTSITLNLPDTDATAAPITLVARDANGVELGRFTGTAAAEGTVNLPSGTVFISIESSGSAEYSVSLFLDQAPVTIASVAPLSAPRGTPVTIIGQGFGQRLADVLVMFGGVPAGVVSVTPGRIDAIVPGNAADGPVTVVVGNREAVGPGFVSGNGLLPAPFFTPWPASSRTVDPLTGALTYIDRLTVTADPLASRAEIEQRAKGVGAQLVGYVAGMHRYVLGFSGNRSLNTLQAARQQLQADPLVRRVSFARFERLDEIAIDVRDIADEDDREAYERVKIFEAIEAIRTTPAFESRSGLRPVRVAIIDDGFDPGASADEFEAPEGAAIRLLAYEGGTFRSPADPTVNGKHGTPVAGVIAALNNRRYVNGMLNGVVQPGEQPHLVDSFRIHEFHGMDTEEILAAIRLISSGGYDVVSMSLGGTYSDLPSQALVDSLADYRAAILPSAARTLFVFSAGNNAIYTNERSPCLLSLTMPNVMCIGAVATATNADRTNDGPDARADYGGTEPPPRRATLCNPQKRRPGSNCGTAVTLAAPGEDLLTMLKGGGSDYFTQTSAATPVVAGVAALVQTIRPGLAPIAPDLLRALLVSSGDDITGTWRPGPMRRLNALAAVRAVLGDPRSQKIYVSDDDENAPGFVVAVEIDPLTGEAGANPPGNSSIPLTVRARGTTIELSAPTAIATAVAADRMYVAVETDGVLGDGIAVVNTHTLKAIDFIPLSGVPFPTPAGATMSPPVKFGSKRPGLALSRDARILYVATTDRLVIVNVVAGLVVKKLADLPPAYRARARLMPAGALNQRMTTLSNVRASFVVNGATSLRSFGDLTLSPDGRTLFVAVRTGSGSGYQPGFVIPVNVDLYADADSKLLLQSDLSRYLEVGTPIAMIGAGAVLGGDEPSALAISPDGKYLYMVNGGLKELFTVPPDEINVVQRYADLVIQNTIGIVVGGGGLLGLVNSQVAFANSFPFVLEEMRLDLKLQAESGLTLVNASGATGVFDTTNTSPGTIGSQSWMFTSDVAFGWNPPAANGGRIVNQFRFKEVFAKRPFDLALRPDGKRALMPLFQTGNFAVLDLDAQLAFSNPTAADLPSTLFKGVAGVTQAIRLDNHLWPRRGAYRSADGVFVPSPDENLMFPSDVEYAQNGRFAAAIHTGVNRPRIVSALLPDFAFNNEERLALNGIGFSIEPGASSGLDPEGNPVTSLQPYLFDRGGGTLTVLRDSHIGNDLLAHATQMVTGPDGAQRPYFSQNPVCVELDPTFPRCSIDVHTRAFSYDLDGGERRFSRPRGVAIQPFVGIETPRFGDHVFRTSPVQARWRDRRVEQVLITIHDLGTANAPLPASILVNGISRALTPRERQVQTLKSTILGLFAGGPRPTIGHYYRVTVAVSTSEAELSRTSVDVFLAR